jgi:cytochrome c-type biogenesis protein CcmH/NrfG
VARGTQHRKRRTGPNAKAAAPAVAAPRKQRPPQWQEQLFFQRLRVHAKWAFVLLAFVFALGFVFLGIGSGSNGITDALQSAFNFGSGSGGTSISSLEHKTQKHPRDATAWRDLATAYETKQRTNDAIRALERYTLLRPKDTSAYAELATQYTNQAQTYAQQYQTTQASVSAVNLPSSTFAPPSTSPLGKAYTDAAGLKDPIAAAVQSVNSTTQQTAYTGYTSAQQNAEKAYQKLVKLTPNDANAQLELGQAAQNAGDTNAAVAAYKKFLKLSPNDTYASQVKAALKQLQPPKVTASTAAGKKVSASTTTGAKATATTNSKGSTSKSPGK